MTVFPGMTSTTRTDITASERAKSFARLLIRLTFIPGAGCTSKRVMTGPGLTAVTSISMPKSFSLSSRSLDMASRDSFEKPESLVSCQASSKPMAGSSLIDEAANRVPCFSFSTRALFAGFLIPGALIFGGTRLASFSIWISRTFLRLSRRFLVTCSCFLSSIHF